MEVRQDHPDLVDLLVALEDGPGHDPDRGLDGRAVVVGEDLEERRSDSRERFVEVEIGRAVAPDGGELRGHEAVVRIAQRRVAVAREAGKTGARRLQDDEVLHAGLDGRLAADRGHGRDPGALAPTDERVIRRRSGDIDRPPVVAPDIDRRPVHLAELQEVLGERPAIVLQGPVEVILGERVGRVLHRVGRDDA